MIIIKTEDLLDPEKRKKLEEKIRQEKTPQEIEKLKEIAKGGKGTDIKEAENARYILFVIGESYVTEGEEGKEWGIRADEWAGRKLHILTKKKMNAVIGDEKRLYREILNRSKENGVPTNLRELEPFLKRKKVNAYVTLLKKEGGLSGNEIKQMEAMAAKDNDKLDGFFEKYDGKVKEIFENKRGNKWIKLWKKELKGYNSDLKKIEKTNRAGSLSKKLNKVEKTSIGGRKISLGGRIKIMEKGLLKKYNPALYRSARRIISLEKTKKLAKIPSIEKALVEAGRPDLVYGPEKLEEYLKLMDREGLEVSKLSAEVWKCTKAIDALSDAQLYELATQGNPAALDYLRDNIRKNPWLLIGNKNFGGEYKPRRGTGVSRFALKSAFALDPGMLEDFFKGAQGLMPRNKYEEWTKELLAKTPGEEVLAWDNAAFNPRLTQEAQNRGSEEGYYKINPTSLNIEKYDKLGNLKKTLDSNNPEDNEELKSIIDPDCLFMVYTRFAHPTQLGLIPPNGTLAENRKPIITEALIRYKGLYADRDTQKQIEDLEKSIEGGQLEIIRNELDKFWKDLEELDADYIQQSQASLSDRANEIINKFKLISVDLSERSKESHSYKTALELKNKIQAKLNIEDND